MTKISILRFIAISGTMDISKQQILAFVFSLPKTLLYIILLLLFINKITLLIELREGIPL